MGKTERMGRNVYKTNKQILDTHFPLILMTITNSPKDCNSGTMLVGRQCPNSFQNEMKFHTKDAKIGAQNPQKLL